MSNDTAVLDFSSLYGLVQDAGAVIAFTSLVADDVGAPVLHVDDSHANQLVITITNQTSGEITVSSLTGAPTANNANITFTLPNNQFYFYTLPTLDTSGSVPGTWMLATNSNGGGWVSAIYLANTGVCTLGPNGQPNDTLTLTINYGGAVPDDPRAVNAMVQISYQHIVTASGVPLQGSTPPQSMALMADAGRPSPLVGAFVGPATILNDGTTSHSLTLRMVNTSQDPLQFIVPPTGSPTQSYIEVVLPVSDQPGDAAWALCDTAAWNQVNPTVSSSSAGWSVAKSRTSPGTLELRPDFSQVKNIPANGILNLMLSNVTSALPPGFVQVQVSLERFALLGTQTFGVLLEKSPLVYNTGLGTGMTLAAGTLDTNHALNITGDSSSALVALAQNGSGTTLAVSGEVTVTGSSSSPLMSLTQDGVGPALTTSGHVGVNTANPAVTLDVQGETHITAPAGTLPLTVRSDNPGGPAAEISIANFGGSQGTESTLSFRTYAPPQAGIQPSSAIVAQDDGSGSNHLHFQTKTPGMMANSLQNRMTVTSRGYVGINTDSPGQYLDVKGNINVSEAIYATQVYISGALNANTGLFSRGAWVYNGFSAHGNVSLCPAADYTSGTVGIGTVGHSLAMLQVNNTQTTGYGVYVEAPNLNTGAGWWALAVHGGCINTTGSWVQFSDIRLKEAVQPFSDGLSQVLQMNPIQYNYKEETGLGPKHGHVGISAQEVEKIAPYMIGKARLKPDGEEEYLSLDNGPLTYMLINAIKELDAKIESERTDALRQKQVEEEAARARQVKQAAAQETFIATLEGILGKPLAATEKQKLVSSLQGLLTS